MGDFSEILVLDDDAVSRAAMAEYLSEHDPYRESCRVCGFEEVSQNTESVRIVLLEDEGQEPVKDALCFVKPVRVGAVLDSIDRILKQIRNQKQQQMISFAGGWVLDTLYNTLQQKQKAVGKDVRLTEKEKDILVLLYQHTGESVSREALLQNVWAYAEGVETHTLETHIYRLRQKIEKDPATPQILLTTETGYQLAS